MGSYCAPAVALAALAARAFARFATSAAFRAGDSFLFATAVLAAVFFWVAGFDLAAAAFFSAHRFFNAATMFALPALLSFRFAFGASGIAGAGDSDSPRILAHRSCWASFMRRRAAAENSRRLIVGASGVAAGVGLAGPPFNMARSSAICVSIRSFSCSKPTMAALIIWGVRFVGMCDVLSGFSLSCIYC